MFFIEVHNNANARGLLCKTPEGIAFSNMICGETTYFYSHTSASVEANKLRKKFRDVKVINMQSLIDDQEKGKQYGISNGGDALSDECSIVGYTDDGVKHWIHYDASIQKYYPVAQEAGACVWHSHQTDGVITALEQDETMSIKKFTAEKIEKTNEN